jgi:hypothetical protein
LNQIGKRSKRKALTLFMKKPVNHSTMRGSYAQL